MSKLYKQVITKLNTRQSSSLINVPKYGKFSVADLELVIMCVEQDLPLNHVPKKDPLYNLYVDLAIELTGWQGTKLDFKKGKRI